MFELLILFESRDCIITNKYSIFIFLNRKLMNTYIILYIVWMNYKYLKKDYGGGIYSPHPPPRLTATVSIYEMEFENPKPVLVYIQCHQLLMCFG
jgi:hypothetical protein